MRHLFFTFLALVVISTTAQDKTFNLEESVLGWQKGLYPTSLRGMQWVDGENKYAHRKGDSYFILPATALPDAKVAEQITLASIQKSIEGVERMPYLSTITSSVAVFNHKNAYHIFQYKGKDIGKDIVVPYAEKGQHQDFHLASKQVAYTIDNNLYIGNTTSAKIPVVENADPNIVTGQAIHRFEFGISKGTFWSPSGKSLAFYQKDETDVADYPLLDISTRTGSLKSIKYPMAGENTEYGKVGIYNTEAKKVVYLNTGQPKEFYVSNVTWGPEEKYIYIVEMNRGQDHFWFTQYDASTGEKVKTLFEEQHNTFLQPVHQPYFIPGKNNEFLFLSERDGYFNIYQYNTTGKMVAKVTNHKWEVTGIVGFDQKNQILIYEGTGPDGRENHVYSVSLKNKKNLKLTKEPGTHHASISSNGTYILDSYSNLNTARKINAVDTKKGKTTELFTANNPLDEYKSGTVEFVTLKSKEGYDLYGRVIKPSDFDSTKTYPVLVYVYGGPGVQLITNSWNAGASLWMNWLAEQGYIVFTVDNRGTSNRGRAFKEVIHRQLGTNEIEDQMIGVEYLKSKSYVDANRIAVHGWSFGGFMTTSLMLRTPGVFTTGVAGGPVIDWKWYEIMYGERYMDTPQENPEGYEKASLLNYVTNLEGKLLMIHGTVDDVVVMQHNLGFVEKCVKEGVQIDFFPYPMHPHNVRGKDRVHLMTKVLNYIIENNK